MTGSLAGYRLTGWAGDGTTWDNVHNPFRHIGVECGTDRGTTGRVAALRLPASRPAEMNDNGFRSLH